MTEREWDKYCGDKDLWEKFELCQLYRDSKPSGPAGMISAIYRNEGYEFKSIGVNTSNIGVFPVLVVDDNDESILRFYFGKDGDYLKLYKS